MSSSGNSSLLTLDILRLQAWSENTCQRAMAETGCQRRHAHHRETLCQSREAYQVNYHRILRDEGSINGQRYEGHWRLGPALSMDS